MKGSENETRRSFLKKLAAGTALVVAGVSARPSSASTGEGQRAAGGQETLYSETEEFRNYYKSLKA